MNYHLAFPQKASLRHKKFYKNLAYSLRLGGIPYP